MNANKLLPTLTLAAVASCLMAAYTTDIMRELHIEPAKLRQDVVLNLKEPNWFFFTPTNAIRQSAKQLPTSSRAATVKALGQVVRAYVESSAFNDAWLQDVRSTYPYDDSFSDEKLAQKQQANQAEKEAMNTQLAAVDQAFTHMDPAMLQMAIRAQISQEEQKIASLSGEERSQSARQVATLKKILMLPPADCKKQYLAYLKQVAQGQLAANQAETMTVDKEQLAQYRRQKAAFDAHADFRPLLKKRLQDFITLCESIDFEARLVPMGSKQAFANPVYQRKPAEWKFLYRMGREPVTEASAFAKQWLADLK